jgi:hypothetical protein
MVNGEKKLNILLIEYNDTKVLSLNLGLVVFIELHMGFGEFVKWKFHFIKVHAYFYVTPITYNLISLSLAHCA